MKKQLKAGDKVLYKDKEYIINKVVNEKGEDKYICGYLKLTNKHLYDTTKPSSNLPAKGGQLPK